MSYMAKRRGESPNESKEHLNALLLSNPPIFRPFIKIWIEMWRAIYFLVSVLTYVGLLVGLGMTIYFSFYAFDWKRAIIGGLCTLLIIYVNKVNPK